MSRKQAAGKTGAGLRGAGGLVDGRRRLDAFLFETGYFQSREKARAAVMAGKVSLNGRTEDKPGTGVGPNPVIKVENEMPYVSRGGLKLEKALFVFGIDLKNKTVLDVGASSGGFTDCALQHGAARVYAVDVGYGQLAWKLRTDPRVVVMERTNARDITPSMFTAKPCFAAVDVSFISVLKILKAVAGVMTDHARGVILIKPQFEAGREKVGKKGVIRDPLVHIEVLRNISSGVRDCGWNVTGMDYSPVKGPKGNIEYLMDIDFSGTSKALPPGISDLVERAHYFLTATPKGDQ